ncbi:Translation initiation factor 3 subunit b [Pyricularia oryzae]|uniref:Eukaryotic translation initiation factor 3 subunit B n=5 Tax=Pyricularia TaxID=48558 RepID=EIF3B_PYRO7|nr:eukaryotic translation initiation factor 3 subunit B [Pyricularia oryzae 70-15]A4QZL9.1 RecName: Full=Eukaryotic translation initiation factor 3 subunit B; Short=eIF3b; AltName: Full=Eukaryotic translation initiation factor 3 90 kDa subunit homolog; Short=eIF3 p90; AltName: Full=Translation initiation factor eIF3 p90 subunit homolog [Pyricularia oryzae 70-15]ELQ34409.1 eukaryotic translation initiation factor 3 subunit B [Pyricularia oryzae Y34]KAH9436262.1 Translation initiation factor 3 sub
MAPSYEHLREADLDEDEFDEDEVDVSDLREKFEVQLEQGFDTFVVIDGLPEVTEEQKPKLVKFLLKKLTSVGKTKEDMIDMPMGPDGKSLRFAFVEYSSPGEAAAAVRQLDRVPLDKKHTLRVNKLMDVDRFGREGRIDDEYQPPHIDEFHPRDHLRSFMADPSGRGRDQFVMFRGDHVGVFWNNEKDTPENIVDRPNWTESFVQWSPLGTYLLSMHMQGVQLWGGPKWDRLGRFPHPFVNMAAFSPQENYLVTWSNRPISIPDEGHPALSMDDDGKNYVIWDIATGKPLRSFANLDLPPDDPNKPPRKHPWPAFKWSSDDKYVARLTQGQSISVYELPRMNLLDKTTIKVEGVQDFEWAPSRPQRDGVKTYEQMFCYWTPEIGSNPAKVGLMSIPSKEVVRSLNLFSVSDVKLHWQSEGAYLCVKVDRHSKSKKSQATTLEIFRVKEKGVPVEVVDTIKDTVINFAWEPKGDRFLIITTVTPTGEVAVQPKTAISFFCPEKSKGSTVGNFKHLRTLDKRNSNAIYWSPKGRFVVVATVHNQNSSDLDFFDLDFEGEKPEGEKDLTANLQLMNTADHYGITDVEWDPSGRFVATWASAWKHTMENGYHMYDFKGEQLREEAVEKFKQLQWRPRPPTLLAKEEQKQIRKNLREYSRVFEQEDAERIAGADQEVVDNRRRILEDWYEWRESVDVEVDEESAAMGVSSNPAEELLKAKTAEILASGQEEEQVIEEIVEEVLEESEEIVS